MGLTKIGKIIADYFEIQDVDDRTPQEKIKMAFELYQKAGLTIRELDNMSVKEVLNFKRKKL